MSESAGNASLKRTTEEAFSSPNRCLLMSLPEDVVPFIINFQAHKDRISIAATCKNLLKVVEAFSERELTKIRPLADETWDERIADDSSIETEMPRPLELPHRYLLWKAHRSYMYVLKEDVSGRAPSLFSAWTCLQLLPDGKLFSSTPSGFGLVWDLSKETSVNPVESGNIGDSYRSMIHGERIITTSRGGNLQIHSFDGELLLATQGPEDGRTISSWTASRNKLYFTQSSGSVYCLDLFEGAVRTISGLQLRRVPEREVYCNLVTVSNVLLTLNRWEGVYVHDLESLEKKDFFQHGYRTLVEAADGSGMIVACGIANIDVLAVEHDRLVRRYSYPLASGGSSHLLYVYKSRAYIRRFFVVTGKLRRTRIEVYNLVNGELEYTIDEEKPARNDEYCGNTTVVTDGRILYVGAKVVSDPDRCLSPCIWAYPL